MKVKGCLVLGLVCGLLEGAYFNTQMDEVCAVCSRARTKQGRGLIEKIW